MRHVPALLLLAACPGGDDDDATPADTDELLPCESSTVDACPTDRCSALHGERLDLERVCVAETRGFCLEGTEHDLAITTALDPDGARWWFGSTTIPEGWEAVPTTGEDEAAWEAGNCP